MILRINHKGERVKELQTLLKYHGCFNHQITDFFGTITYKAVIRFQKENGLDPDGLVGPKTWEKLTSHLKSNITPTYSTNEVSEDFDDDEEEFKVEEIKDNQPSSPYISELIHLINSSDISRNIIRLVFHCTATQPTATVEAIQRYWKNVRKWKSPGYHIIIKSDGSWVQLLDFNKISNGVAGKNSTSINVSYIGGVDKNGKALDTRTPEQIEVLETIYTTFKNKLPNITFHGHYKFSNKACPSFNVERWIKNIEENAK